MLKQDELPRKGELHTTTSLLQSCLSPGGRGGNVWTGELLSTQKSSEELINCWLFPCFVIRKHPEGAGTQEVVFEDVGNPCSHPTSTYLYSLHFFYHWLFSLKTHPHWSVPTQGYCQRQQRDQTSRQELGPSSGSRGKVNDISPCYRGCSTLYWHLDTFMNLAGRAFANKSSLDLLMFGNMLFKSRPWREMTQWTQSGTSGRDFCEQGRTSTRLQVQDLVSLTLIQAKHMCN